VAKIERLWQGPFQKYVVLSYFRERAVWPLVSALKRKEAASMACCNYKALLSQDRLHNFSDLTLSKRSHYGDFFFCSLYILPPIALIQSNSSSPTIHPPILPSYRSSSYVHTYLPTHPHIHQYVQPIDPKQVGRVQSANQKMNHTLPSVSALMLLRNLDPRERSFHPQLTSVQFVWANSLYPGGYYPYHRV